MEEEEKEEEEEEEGEASWVLRWACQEVRPQRPIGREKARMPKTLMAQKLHL